MLLRKAGLPALLVTMAACGGGGNSSEVVSEAGTTEAAPASMAAASSMQAPACEPVERMPVAGRESPFDSASVQLAGAELKVCYGRPSMRDREIFGGLVPYDTIWRTGANEPTIVHVPVAADIAGIAVEPGPYALYTVPGQQQWTVIVNRSTTQWGIESQYTDEIRAEEVGRAQVPAETLDSPVEMFTITGESTGHDVADLVLQWERTSVRIPVSAR